MSSIKISEIEDISQVTPPKDYVDIWKEISYKVQKQKALNHRLSEEAAAACFLQLQKRPYYLASIAERLNVKNIAEVGI